MTKVIIKNPESNTNSIGITKEDDIYQILLPGTEIEEEVAVGRESLLITEIRSVTYVPVKGHPDMFYTA